MENLSAYPGFWSPIMSMNIFGAEVRFHRVQSEVQSNPDFYGGRQQKKRLRMLVSLLSWVLSPLATSSNLRSVPKE